MPSSSINIAQYGISDVQEIVYNPSYEQLFEEETNPKLEGYEKGVVTEFGAVNVNTGVFTGRSPKDKYIVKDAVSDEHMWWNSEDSPNDNKPISFAAIHAACLLRKSMSATACAIWRVRGARRGAMSAAR